MVGLLALLMPVFNLLGNIGASGSGVRMLSTASNADLNTFTGFATTVLQWFVTSMGTVLTFLITNPIALWSIIVGMIVAVIGMIFNILHGR